MLSLSSCWNSHRFQEVAPYVSEVRELGFEYLELSHGFNVSLLPGIIEAVDAGKIRVSSVHNFCPAPVEVQVDAPDAFEFTSDFAEDRERAIKLTIRTLELAARVQAPRVVLHLGSVKMPSMTKDLEALTKSGKIYSREYIRKKLEFVTERHKVASTYLDRAKAALDELIPHCEKNRVVLGIETRSHFEQVPSEKEMFELMAHYQDCPWIGFWHDFGHVQRKANLGFLNHEEVLCRLAPKLLGCHVHDVIWPHRDHQIPLATQGVDFDRLLPLVPVGIPLVWELSRGHKVADVQKYVQLWIQKFGA